MRYSNEQTLTIPDVSVTTNGLAIDTAYLAWVSVQVTATGSPSATVKLQASNDSPGNESIQPTNWSDITDATVSVSSTTPVLIPKTDICYRYIRVVFTGGGTGTAIVRTECIGF